MKRVVQDLTFQTFGEYCAEHQIAYNLRDHDSELSRLRNNTKQFIKSGAARMRDHLPIARSDARMQPTSKNRVARAVRRSLLSVLIEPKTRREQILCDFMCLGLAASVFAALYVLLVYPAWLVTPFQ